MIGLSSILLLASLGRIAGISGIVWGSFTQPDSGWRWLFLVGLIAGGVLVHSVTGLPKPSASEAPAWLAVVAGLLVGIGTRMGSGCTSGHGVCGIGRLSLRSLVATVTFMGAGIITVFVTRHLLGGL